MNTNESASILPMHAQTGIGAARAVTGDRLIRLPQVLSLVGIGKTLVYALIKQGKFPQPRKVRHISLWVESEVQEWIREVAETAA